MQGTSPRFLMLGFMLPTAFLSMWISNNATTAMMLPIMDAVLAELEGGEKGNLGGGGDAEAKKSPQLCRLRAMLAMALAYSANVGGTGTIIGTPGNLVFMEAMDSSFSDHPVTFVTWIAFAMPQTLLCLVCVWVWLQVYFLEMPRWFGKGNKEEEGERVDTKESRFVHVFW